jgi:hypothetical protein
MAASRLRLGHHTLAVGRVPRGYDWGRSKGRAMKFIGLSGFRATGGELPTPNSVGIESAPEPSPRWLCFISALGPFRPRQGWIDDCPFDVAGFLPLTTDPNSPAVVEFSAALHTEIHGFTVSARLIEIATSWSTEGIELQLSVPVGRAEIIRLENAMLARFDVSPESVRAEQRRRDIESMRQIDSMRYQHFNCRCVTTPLFSDRYRNPIALGDSTCANSANSPHLRCAINPCGPCEGCTDYTPKENQ